MTFAETARIQADIDTAEGCLFKAEQFQHPALKAAAAADALRFLVSASLRLESAEAGRED